MVWSSRAYRVENLDQRRPSLGIMRRRRRGGEESRVVDDETVVRIARSDCRDLSKHRALVVCTRRHAGAPVAIEKIERRQLGIGKLEQPVRRMAVHYLHDGKVLKRGRGLSVQFCRALNSHNPRKDRPQPASCAPKVSARLDCALEVKLFPETASQG